MHCSKFLVACIAFGLGATSVVSIALAISTDYWLLMFEEVDIPNTIFVIDDNFNDLMAEGNWTEDHEPGFTTDPIPNKMEIHAKIGLFRFCVLYRDMPKNCVPLDYTHIIDRRKEDKQETAAAIAEAQREATPVFLTGFFLIICSTLFNIVGNVRGNFLTLVAAVVYINAGLCIAVGMILYITFINDETSHAKKREDLAFTYSYGWSAYMVGVCFFASEFAAVVCIRIFISRFPSSEDKLRIIPGLSRKFSVPIEHSNPTLIL